MIWQHKDTSCLLMKKRMKGEREKFRGFKGGGKGDNLGKGIEVTPSFVH